MNLKKKTILIIAVWNNFVVTLHSLQMSKEWVAVVCGQTKDQLIMTEKARRYLRSLKSQVPNRALILPWNTNILRNCNVTVSCTFNCLWWRNEITVDTAGLVQFLNVSLAIKPYEKFERNVLLDLVSLKWPYLRIEDVNHIWVNCWHRNKFEKNNECKTEKSRIHYIPLLPLQRQGLTLLMSIMHLLF